MVSNQKRRYISESTTDDDTDYTPNNQPRKPGRKPTRTPKCFSKNALVARENRIKKKVYITNLENEVSSLNIENKKFSAIVENQSFMIEEFKKEIKYLKSVISNSESIGKLIGAISTSTGMSVTSSLDKQLTVNTKGALNRSPVASQTIHGENQWGRKVQRSEEYICDIPKKHPWEEKDKMYTNYPTPDSNHSYYSNPEFDELNNDGLLLDLDIPFEINNDELLGIINDKDLESPLLDCQDDHNYHNPIEYEQDSGNSEADDVGVCLHVSKNKVSLEFCPTCSDNASQSRRPT